MDNNELDKIIKEKLKDTIKPSKEFEDKIKQNIIDQKNKFRQVKDEKKQNKKISYKTIASITSVAAVLVVTLTTGLLYLNKDGNFGLPKIPGISGNQSEKNNKSNIATIKAIEPIKLKSGLIEKDTEFSIKVEEDSSVEAVQRSLYVEPALEYEITKTGTNEFKLKFKQNIPDNTILKLQYVKDQITENSWAYQTNTNLSVTNIYPANNSTYVSKNTTMEIELSYADVENFEENVSINPKTDGRWEHKGKLWRFIPESPLKEGKYTIIVNKNILADGKNMEDDFVFNFSVSSEQSSSSTYVNYIQDKYTADGIETFSPEEQIKIFYVSYGNDVEIKKVKIAKFDTADEFIKAVESKNYDNAKYIGDYEFDDVRKAYDDKFIALKKNLPIGYYVATIESEKGKELFKCPIQISKIQAYVMESEKDIIAWVAEDRKTCKRNKY